jgi:hypothetical protein
MVATREEQIPDDEDEESNLQESFHDLHNRGEGGSRRQLQSHRVCRSDIIESFYFTD